MSRTVFSSGVAWRPSVPWPCASMFPRSRPTLSQALSATSSGYLCWRRGQRRSSVARAATAELGGVSLQCSHRTHHPLGEGGVSEDSRFNCHIHQTSAGSKPRVWRYFQCSSCKMFGWSASGHGSVTQKIAVWAMMYPEAEKHWTAGVHIKAEEFSESEVGGHCSVRCIFRVSSEGTSVVMCDGLNCQPSVAYLYMWYSLLRYE